MASTGMFGICVGASAEAQLAPTSGAQYMSDTPFDVTVLVDCVMSRTVDRPKSDTAACSSQTEVGMS